jgi:hypothetical protein
VAVGEHLVGGVPLRAGVRLLVQEADYLYGTGPAEIVVGSVERMLWYADEEWVELQAHQLIGTATVPRVISVRVGALRAAASGAK